MHIYFSTHSTYMFYNHIFLRLFVPFSFSQTMYMYPHYPNLSMLIISSQLIISNENHVAYLTPYVDSTILQSIKVTFNLYLSTKNLLLKSNYKVIWTSHITSIGICIMNSFFVHFEIPIIRQCMKDSYNCISLHYVL